jgi:hypothetical protein
MSGGVGSFHAVIRRRDTGTVAFMGFGRDLEAVARGEGENARRWLAMIAGDDALGPVEVSYRTTPPAVGMGEPGTGPAATTSSTEIIAELRRLTNEMCKGFDRLVREMNRR